MPAYRHDEVVGPKVLNRPGDVIAFRSRACRIFFGQVAVPNLVSLEYRLRSQIRVRPLLIGLFLSSLLTFRQYLMKSFGYATESSACRM